ncbi:DNA polymerase alpha catalytic subunit [Larimichthys crocea]|uniref:Uncharacterized protein n=1 Tax=Larimichthys crocea TaxID=215358 RepID=A0ACD3QQT4_LARCR|nr:DNA polymerase alpha catalytic subunit [Larimichthys crocea]
MSTLRLCEGSDSVALPSIYNSTFCRYSEKALYNQLCFYRFIFDWEYAVAKVLPPEERSRTKTWNREEKVYRRLKEVPDKALATSGYSEINLAKLFQAFSSIK